jgi:hypothetical protein
MVHDLGEDVMTFVHPGILATGVSQGLPRFSRSLEIETAAKSKFWLFIQCVMICPAANVGTAVMVNKGLTAKCLNDLP